jgi:hypothetical protein
VASGGAVTTERLSTRARNPTPADASAHST